jgi:hypothetical protein
MKDTVNFVGGYLRTGTTLLQSILCSGVNTNPMIGESVYLRGILESYNTCMATFDDNSHSYFDDREDLRKFCAGQMNAFFEKTRTRHGNPQHLILKHPYLTPAFPTFYELNPEIKFVIILRDPRDSVASAMVAKSKGAEQFKNKSALQVAQEINFFFEQCINCPDVNFHKNTIFLKYERLVGDPTSTIEILQHFLGIDLSGFNPHDENADLMQVRSDENPFHTELYGKAISDKSIGKYKDVLAGSDIEQIETLCKQILDVLSSPAPTVRVEPSSSQI